MRNALRSWSRYAIVAMLLTLWATWAALPHAGASQVSGGVGESAASSQQSAPSVCNPSWNIVNSPDARAGTSQLMALAAVASNNVWAVGSSGTDGTFETLVEHWNGSAWSLVPSPNMGAGENVFYAVDAITATDIWAVGYWRDAYDQTHPLTEHWDGSSWSIFPAPDAGNVVLVGVDGSASNDVWTVGGTTIEHWDGSSWSVAPSLRITNPSATSGPGVYNGDLTGVTSLTANDAWVVGNVLGAASTLIEHWDGSSWTIVNAPSPNYHELVGVAAITANDIWAVGSIVNGNAQTLVEHWDGTSWSIIPSPNPGTINNLVSVSALADNDVWVVGKTGAVALVMHWDGTNWSVVSSPNPTGNPDALNGVAALSSSDVWVVGSYTYNSGGGGSTATLTENGDASGLSFVPSPNDGPSDNTLSGVSASSANDIWAVGSYGDVFSGTRTLTQHWDGTGWSIIPSANAGYGYDTLNAVASVSLTDTWAVGQYLTTNNVWPALTLVEHWDGSNWTIIPSPSLDLTGSNSLLGVGAISSSDIWAVGSGISATLTEHWNGSSWSIVPSPNQQPERNNTLAAVAGVATNDVWAVGWDGTNANLIEHWDGSSWSIVPSPNQGNYVNQLHSLVALASNNVWAVGYGSGQALIAHWDGNTWSLLPSPNLFQGGYLNGVSALGPNDIWAVGYSNYGYPQTLTEHWDGSSWSVVSSGDIAGNHNYLNGVVKIAPDNVWAVGSVNNTVNLIERYSAYCPTPTPTATATFTPAPTFTPQPTICANPFVDINTNIFFHAINYLYCQGVVSGTDPSHYSPAGTSTRAQFAKVVALGFGLSLYTPTSGPTFSDVPPGYFAYVYIESGYHAGILQGFDMNSCQAHNAQYPCYLPNTPITRGQLTKLVVSAAHYPLYTPISGQTFNDVPPSNVFYVSIETAHQKGVISGYPGGYFLPNQGVRRDEMAQIVYKGVTTP